VVCEGLKLYYLIDLFVPTNALRQFFHCLLYYYDAPIRISAVILPSSGGILRSFYIDQFFGYVITVSQYLPHRIKLGHRNNKVNSEKTVLVHLLVQINQL
jgi:hypothetical protein